MDEIEARIVLPPGAAPLDHYARTYGLDEKGKVAAAYGIPYRPGPDDGCEELLEYGAWRDVPCDPIEGLAAGQRSWVGDAKNLKMAIHGGCTYVRLLYDPTTKRFERVACNDRH